MADEVVRRKARRETLKETTDRFPERLPAFKTLSNIPVEDIYTAYDLSGHDCLRDVGLPDEYPYTRGVHPTMYRGRLWTMRQYAGYATAVQEVAFTLGNAVAYVEAALAASGRA